MRKYSMNENYFCCTSNLILRSITVLAVALVLSGYGANPNNSTAQGEKAVENKQAKIKYSAEKGDILAIINTAEGIEKDGKNAVVIINQKKHELLAIQETDQPIGYHSHGLGATPHLDKIYMPSFHPQNFRAFPDPKTVSPLLYVLDGKTLETVKTIDAGFDTHHVFYDHDNVYVTVVDGYVLRINPKTNEVIAKIGPLYGSPDSVVVTPDGKYAYVSVYHHMIGSGHTVQWKGWVSKIDLQSNQEVQMIQVGPFPRFLKITKDGKTLYVINTGSQDISVIDTATDKVVSTIKDEKIQKPYGIVLSPDEKSLYITSKYAGFKVQDVDIKSGKVVREVSTGAMPDHLRISPDGKEIWTGTNGSNEVYIIDRITFRIIKSIKLPGDVHEVAFAEVTESFNADPSFKKPYIHVTTDYTYEEKISNSNEILSVANSNKISSNAELYKQRCGACHVAPNVKDPKTLQNFERMSITARLSSEEKAKILNYIKN